MPSLYTRTLCVIGVVLSLYALYVEHKTSHKYEQSTTTTSETSTMGGIFGEEEEFKALCDIESIGASCSQVFALPEGRMLTYFGIVEEGSILDVPNAMLGFLYYTIIFLSESFLPKTSIVKKLTVVMNCMAMSSSIFLGTKLYQLRELCVLCISTHILNTLLLIYYVKLLMKNTANKSKVE
ncbi:hypothetical protein CTEN210_04560 [Chaetoceros tenuissimus]|uniref:vitamin-K-epoxide reductase (warfarin-sensitive) n=1 Tax=Chaetoceros tenuissimus TaxID=426638 RepID=A0AAD3CLW3_9STRA|nr:hypothetical protein CTEN210_04560 [Chaetoceros tenuissimus]